MMYFFDLTRLNNKFYGVLTFTLEKNNSSPTRNTLNFVIILCYRCILLNELKTCSKAANTQGQGLVK